MRAVVLELLPTFAIGLLVASLGGGGSVLAFPLLLDHFHLPVHTAASLSLLMVGTTAAVALAAHARAGRVAWRAGLVFGLSGAAGAACGGTFSRHVPETLLVLGFAALMGTTALGMLRGLRGASAEASSGEEAPPPRPVAMQVAAGLGVGLVAGLLGAGGGFLVVPTLMAVAGLTIGEAVATSLLAVVMNTFGGVVGHMGHDEIPWRLGLELTLAMVLGGLLGARIGQRLPAPWLRGLFAGMLLLVAAFMVWRRLPGLAVAG